MTQPLWRERVASKTCRNDKCEHGLEPVMVLGETLVNWAVRQILHPGAHPDVITVRAPCGTCQPSARAYWHARLGARRRGMPI